MALTKTAWDISIVNGHLVMECDVTHEAADEDSYTLKTPVRTIDPTRSWILMVNTAAVTLDGSACPIDIWAGYTDAFAMTGDGGGTIAANYGVEVASAVIDDAKAVGLAVIIDPNYNGTAVQTAVGAQPVIGIRNCGTAPYYAIHLDGGSAMDETDKVCHYVIIQ